LPAVDNAGATSSQKLPPGFIALSETDMN